MVGSCINDAILNVCDKAYSMNISGKQMGKQGDSAQASVDSAPSSTSDRSLVDSLSSEINEEEAYAEVDPQDEYGIADNKGDNDRPSLSGSTKCFYQTIPKIF